MVTTGDRWSAGGGPAPDKGLFVKELEEALLDGRADLAVHSAKDLPGELPEGLAVLAVPPRADPRDVVVGPPGGLAALPAGARVATGSPRRAAQVLALRPDLEVVPIRGNVDTRLRKLADGAADALVLAAAGLERLGLDPEGAEALAVDACTPAPGQGLLAIEGRADRADLVAALTPLDDPLANACLRAERALLARLGGGCMTPVGALCTAGDAGRLAITAFAGAADGSRGERVAAEGPADDPEALGARAAEKLREVGAVP
ncbi:MAG: hydroxymethylbilane synthase [Miltoncostaeaceae bacterium]|nr:hydroxymethylbilane synthase [Miltoncostaeaceae bacterium]